MLTAGDRVTQRGSVCDVSSVSAGCGEEREWAEAGPTEGCWRMGDSSFPWVRKPRKGDGLGEGDVWYCGDI